jgi:hypothetical protein
METFVYAAITCFGWSIHKDKEKALSLVDNLYTPKGVNDVPYSIYKTKEDDKQIQTNGDELTVHCEGVLQELVSFGRLRSPLIEGEKCHTCGKDTKNYTMRLFFEENKEPINAPQCADCQKQFINNLKN